jgi:hypothetical protein
MADERDTWIGRIKAVEREYLAARFSFLHTLRVVQNEPAILTGNLRIREIERAAQRVEATYVVRLFAEFETALRAFFRIARRRPAPSRTRDLLESVSALRQIPVDCLVNAHAVREYRNVLVHEREGDIVELTIQKARGFLCIYLSFLPRDW